MYIRYNKKSFAKRFWQAWLNMPVKIIPSFPIIQRLVKLPKRESSEPSAVDSE